MRAHPNSRSGDFQDNQGGEYKAANEGVDLEK
jgi:hypothetical protein